MSLLFGDSTSSHPVRAQSTTRNPTEQELRAAKIREMEKQLQTQREMTDSARLEADQYAERARQTITRAPHDPASKRRASEYLEQRKKALARAEVSSKMAATTQGLIDNIRRAENVELQARVTRDAHAALSDITKRIDLTEFEVTREQLEDQVASLADIEEQMSIPIGMDVSQLQETDREADARRDAELEEFMRGEQLRDLHTVSVPGETLIELPITSSPLTDSARIAIPTEASTRNSDRGRYKIEEMRMKLAASKR